VIAGVDHGHPVRLQPVGKRQRRLIEIVSPHLDIPDLEGALDEFVILDRGA